MPKLESDRLKSKLVVQNLKIVVDNSRPAEDEPMDEQEEEEKSEQNKTEETVFHVKLGDKNKKVSKMSEDDHLSDVSDEEDLVDLDQEIELKVGEEEDDETEFHVNLDKVPPSLQNTTLVREN